MKNSFLFAFFAFAASLIFETQAYSQQLPDVLSEAPGKNVLIDPSVIEEMFENADPMRIEDLDQKQWIKIAEGNSTRVLGSDKGFFDHDYSYFREGYFLIYQFTTDRVFSLNSLGGMSQSDWALENIKLTRQYYDYDEEYFKKAYEGSEKGQTRWVKRRLGPGIGTWPFRSGPQEIVLSDQEIHFVYGSPFFSESSVLFRYYRGNDAPPAPEPVALTHQVRMKEMNGTVWLIEKITSDEESQENAKAILENWNNELEIVEIDLQKLGDKKHFSDDGDRYLNNVKIQARRSEEKRLRDRIKNFEAEFEFLSEPRYQVFISTAN